MKKLLILTAISLLGSATSAVAAPASGAEFVYVESNVQAQNGNSIFAYRRGADGNLSPVSGSPFFTNGSGVQDTSFVFGPYDSDQNIVVDAQRQLLFAVNSGSDSIAVFHINGDGSLTAIPGSPFPSGGTDPVSLGLAGDTLFVVNQNGDLARYSQYQPNYTAFHIESDGSLTAVEDSTVNVSYRSSPSQAYVVPGRNLLFGADFRGGLLQSFSFDRRGHLYQHNPTALPPNPNVPTFVSQQLQLGEFPLGLTTHPHLPLLYVGFVVTNQLGVYQYSPAGKLTHLNTVPNSGLAICWLRTNSKGTRLYTANNGVVGDPEHDAFSTLSVYDLSNPESPREIQNLQLAGVGNASQMELSSDERYIYVVSQRATGVIPPGEGNALHTFSIQADGTLVEDHAPITLDVPVGTQPQGVAIYKAR